MKFSQLQQGFGHVVEQQVIEHDGDLTGSVFTWRARKDSYKLEIPSSLCVPFDSWEQAGAYAERLYEEEFVASIRNAKRTQGKCEVKIMFPMRTSAKQAIEALTECSLDTFLPF